MRRYERGKRRHLPRRPAHGSARRRSGVGFGDGRSMRTASWRSPGRAAGSPGSLRLGSPRPATGLRCSRDRRTTSRTSWRRCRAARPARCRAGGPRERRVVPAAAAAVASNSARRRVLLQLVGGYAGGRPFVENDDDELTHLLDLNLWTTAHAIRAFLPDVAAAEHGRIVTVSTFVAQAPTPNTPPTPRRRPPSRRSRSRSREISPARRRPRTWSSSDRSATRSRRTSARTKSPGRCCGCAQPEAGATNGQRINLFGRA